VPTQEQINTAAAAKTKFFDNPVKFVMTNLLMPVYTNTHIGINGGRARFALPRAKDSDYTGERFHGTPIPVHTIVDGTDYAEAAFDGYWCPFEMDQVKQITVWKEGDALFTDRMDGCTFGIGTPGADGAVLVTHVNQSKYEQQNDKSKMIRKQRKKAKRVIGTGGTIFEPPDYRTKPAEEGTWLVSTTFGVRNPSNNTWTFYAQIMEGAGGEYTLRAVKKIA
jgi:hypothetical protein